MNSSTRIDDKLFTPLTARDASVSLAELQQYVTANPHPARSTRPYVAAAIMVCIGVGLLFLLGNNVPEPIITEVPSVPLVAPPVSAPQVAVSPGPAITPVRERSRNQRIRQLRQTASVPKSPVLPGENPGLMEKPLLADPTTIMSQQFALECNEPSLYVTLARIEFPDQQGRNID